MIVHGAVVDRCPKCESHTKMVYYPPCANDAHPWHVAPTRVFLTMEDVSQGVDVIAERIKGLNMKRILAVARGGLIPAAMLSHRTGIRRVGSIQVEARDPSTGTPFTRPFVYDGPLWNDTDTIIIDDIIDTGVTMKALAFRYPNTLQVALISRVPEVPTAIEVPPKAWIVFPWEIG